MSHAALLMGLSTFVLGVICGGLGGLFGIGGGIIAIPLLGITYGMNEQIAQGTALVMIVPNALLGAWKYRRYAGMDLRFAATLAASAILFTFIAARYATALNAQHLRIAFAIFLVALAAYLAWRALRKRPIEPQAEEAKPNWLWSSLIGAIGGILSGLFGVGAATIAPPALTTFFGMSQAAAQGLALALIAPSTVVALGQYAAAKDVNWITGVFLALGGLLSISAGVELAHRLPERALRLLFCGLLVVTAAMLVANS